MNKSISFFYLFGSELGFPVDKPLQFPNNRGFFKRSPQERKKGELARLQERIKALQAKEQSLIKDVEWEMEKSAFLTGTAAFKSLIGKNSQPRLADLMTGEVKPSQGDADQEQRDEVD